MCVLCPGVVATNIFDSERNRPSELANNGPVDSMNRTLDRAFVGEMEVALAARLQQIDASFVGWAAYKG